MALGIKRRGFGASASVKDEAAEQTFGWGMRALLAVIGAAAFVAGLTVTGTELQGLRRGSALLPSLLIMGVACLALLGGALLLRGAVRGRIAVRRTTP